MSRDRHDLVFRCAVVGEPCCRRLAETVSGAVMQASFVAPFAEPATKSIGREGLPEFRHQKREIATRAGINDRAQLRMNWDLESHRPAVPVLLLHKTNPPVSHMLATEQNNVAPALTGEEHERHREPPLAADWMMGFELGDLFLGPRMEAIGLAGKIRHVAGWINDGQLNVRLCRPREDRSKGFDASVRRLGKVSLLIATEN